MADILVIGAGVGGLSAAIRLAVCGHAVTVLEAAPEPGGKLGRSVVDGVEFDTGPSVLTMPDVFAELFEAAGTSLQDEVELVRHEHVFTYFWPDGTSLDVAFDPRETLEIVERTFDRSARDELASFLTYAADIWNAAAPAFVYGDAPNLGTAVNLGLRALGQVRKIDPMRSMIDGIRRHVSNPYLVDVLARYATYNGSDPWQAPATLNCIAHVELALGGFGVRGGMYELARAMTRVAERLGVRFLYDHRVRTVTAREGRVHEVVSDPATFAVDGVVANADAAHVFSELLPSSGHGKSAPPSMSGWTGVLRATRAARPPHAAFFPTTYRDEFRDIFDNGRAPRDPTIYVCSQEKAHGRTGWPDHEPLFVMANAPPVHPRSDEDSQLLHRAAEAKLRAAGWWQDGDELVWERGPTALATAFPGSEGAIYGAASNSRFAAFQRPSNRVSSVKGLYLASGSAHPGGGVPLCALSGAAAARAADEDLA